MLSLASWRSDCLLASASGSQDTFGCEVSGCDAGWCGTWSLETLLGWKVTVMLVQKGRWGRCSKITILWQLSKGDCFWEESGYTCFITSLISNQPGTEPGKCRESWAFSFLVVYSLFILALKKEQQSSGLFSSSQPRQTSLIDTGSLQKKNVEGVGLFSLPFILLEKRKVKDWKWDRYIIPWLMWIV